MPQRMFWFGCFCEIALLGVAAVAAWLFDRPVFQGMFWGSADALWGLGAVLPMLLSFGWMLKSPARFAADVRKFLELMVRPFFAGWSLVELAVISMLAGICEEVLFRGVLQAGLLNLVGTWPALILASVAFGLAHPLSWSYIVGAAGAGFLLGALFLFSGNLLAPMVAHAVYDFCALTWLLRLHRIK